MNSKIFLVALGLLTGASAAGAVTVTFEGQSNAIYNAPITRSGFDFGNVAGDEQHFHEIDSTQFGLASNGTGVPLPDASKKPSDLSRFMLRVSKGNAAPLPVMAPISALGLTAASGTRRTSNTGRCSALSVRRARSTRKPWPLAAMASVSNSAPYDSWLGWPSRS